MASDHVNVSIYFDGIYTHDHVNEITNSSTPPSHFRYIFCSFHLQRFNNQVEYMGSLANHYHSQKSICSKSAK